MLRAFVDRLRRTPGVQVRARLGRPAKADVMTEANGVLHPELLALSAVMDGVAVRWRFTEGDRSGAPSGPGGGFHLLTLRQFLDSDDMAGFEPMGDDDKIQILDQVARDQSHRFPCYVNASDELYLFDGDYVHSLQHSLSSLIAEGIDRFFSPGWFDLFDENIDVDDATGIRAAIAANARGLGWKASD